MFVGSLSLYFFFMHALLLLMIHGILFPVIILGFFFAL